MSMIWLLLGMSEKIYWSIDRIHDSLHRQTHVHGILQPLSLHSVRLCDQLIESEVFPQKNGDRTENSSDQYMSVN